MWKIKFLTFILNYIQIYWHVEEWFFVIQGSKKAPVGEKNWSFKHKLFTIKCNVINIFKLKNNNKPINILIIKTILQQYSCFWVYIL